MEHAHVPRPRRPGRTKTVTALVVGVLLLGSLPGGAVSAQPAAGKHYVEATGHTLAAPFLPYWIQHEGRSTIGLPVSEPQTRAGSTTQFFERGVLTAPSESPTTVAPVRRIAAGRAALAALHDPDRTIAGRRVGGWAETVAFRRVKPAPSSSDRTYVTETGHSIRGAIKAYYDQTSGRTRFGLPLTEAYLSGGMSIQWFDYGRLQAPHRDSGRITAAPVGAELAAKERVDLRSVPRGDLPLLDLGRYRLFAGDGTVPEPARRFVPRRVLIPAIGIDAAVERVDVVDGVMGVPEDAWNVGWYPVFGRPGDNSNVVMSGHKDWWGIGPTVFWDLERLGIGDRIYVVGRDGAGFTYAVTATWWSDPGDSAAVLGDTGVEALTLITCTGAFTGTEYLARLIVRAERI